MLALSERLPLRRIFYRKQLKIKLVSKTFSRRKGYNMVGDRVGVCKAFLPCSGAHHESDVFFRSKLQRKGGVAGVTRGNSYGFLISQQTIQVIISLRKNVTALRVTENTPCLPRHPNRKPRESLNGGSYVTAKTY